MIIIIQFFTQGCLFSNKDAVINKDPVKIHKIKIIRINLKLI